MRAAVLPLGFAVLAASASACSLFADFGGLSRDEVVVVVDGAAPPADANADADGGAGAPEGGALSGYAAAVLADGPRTYLRLEETSGTTAADETGALPGTLEGACTLGAPGRVGRAVAFDGRSCRLSLGTVLPFAGKAPYTIEAWVAPSVVSAQVRFVAYRGPRTASGNRLQVYFNELGIQHDRRDAANAPNGYAGPAPLAAGAFSHVAVVFDGAAARVLVNGVEAGAANAANDIVISPDDELVFGDTGPRVFYKFEGVMDEIAVYDKALTDGRVRAHLEAAK